jgi:hypothetical protein
MVAGTVFFNSVLNGSAFRRYISMVADICLVVLKAYD